MSSTLNIDAIAELVDSLPQSFLVKPRAYDTIMVRFKTPYTIKDRLQESIKEGHNIFHTSSEKTIVDYTSDSGTTSMDVTQWAGMVQADEAYAQNRGYRMLLDQIAATFGERFSLCQEDGKYNIFLTHQGRAAENLLFFNLSNHLTEKNKNNNPTKKPKIVCNGFFDTTRANFEFWGMNGYDFFSPELHNDSSNCLFKGNMDLAKLNNFLEQYSDRVPLVYMTITNNTGGGQPVSRENIQAAQTIAHSYNIPFFLDACRFAENSWFIQQREEGYQNTDIESIVKEIFSFADGFTISFKKDGLSNMGGALILAQNGLFQERYPELSEKFFDDQIRVEGNNSYGGMSGRDLRTVADGLKIVTKQEYLDSRIGLVQYFGESLHKNGVPVVMPVGGHAVYIDMNRFFEGMGVKHEEFRGVGFTTLLWILYGIKACELGDFAFGTYDPATNEHKFPENNYVRFAVKRNGLEKQDIDYTVDAITAIYNNRDKIPAVSVRYGLDRSLRHFKAKFDLLE